MTQSRPQPRTQARGSGEAEARIGRGARVRGRITGHGDLVIEGEVEGDVNVRGDLTIAEGATVTTQSLGADAVTIAGTLEGNIASTGPVRLAASARVRGDLHGSAVSIDEGARFAGRLDCDFELPPELGGAPQGEGRARTGARR